MHAPIVASASVTAIPPEIAVSVTLCLGWGSSVVVASPGCPTTWLRGSVVAMALPATGPIASLVTCPYALLRSANTSPPDSGFVLVIRTVKCWLCGLGVPNSFD